MKAWRIALAKYGRTREQAFGGLSGFSADGRWHSKGRHLDYAAESLSLAILERLVHYKRFDALMPHVLWELDVPDAAIERATTSPAGWDGEALLPAAQAIGDAWCDQLRTPALLVPSAVTPGENNLLINSRHKDWTWSWVTSSPKAFSFESRLLELMRRPKGAPNQVIH